MKIQVFYQLLNRGKSPDKSAKAPLKALVEKYPYFQSAIFAYLKCLYTTDDDMFASELQRISIFVTDRKALFYYILNEEYEKFFKRKSRRRELSSDRTAYLLSSFFDSKGELKPMLKADKAALETNMATYDYFSFLDSPQNKSKETLKDKISVSAPAMKHQSIIDDFINNAEINEKIGSDKNTNTSLKPENKEESQSDLPDDLHDDFFFTETLANIYIKQRKYQKAYEIINRLNLTFPEKSAYFASQISFLEKLIINEKNKKQNG